MIRSASIDALTNAATKRIGYSEVLRVLFTDATGRINKTLQPKFDQPGDVAKGKKANQLRDEFDRLTARQTAIKRQLKFLGLSIPSYNNGPRFTVDHVKQNSAKAVWDHRQQQRLSEVNQLRAKALIDLVDMPRADAKVYLRKLQQTLAKV